MSATKTKKTAAAKTTKTAKAKSAKAKTPKANAPANAAKTKKAKADGKMSAIDAAAKVLADSREPMNCKSLIDAMAAKGLWTSPGGKTPHATLYSAILREINVKGSDARFVKIERGKFASNGNSIAAVESNTKTSSKKGTTNAGGKPGPKSLAKLFKI